MPIESRRTVTKRSERLLFWLLSLWFSCGVVQAQSERPLQGDQPQFQVEIPSVVLSDVPVNRVTITAHDLTGSVDETYEGRPLIEGIKLTIHGRDTALPPFENGQLILETDFGAGRRVYITSDEILVDPENRRKGQQPVTMIWRWASILPPVLAIAMAIWLRNVLVALFAAIWSGAVILTHGNLFVGFLHTLDDYLAQQLLDKDHLLVVLFTVFLGSMIGVMSRSGSTAALVDSLSRVTTNRERGQLMTWLMGLVVFFDDYANTLLVGSTMRPVTDRLKISREKLAFIVDSTAAPIAGLALISTWVGFEVGQIEDTFQHLNVDVNGYSVFLSTIIYRFYPLHLIVFVWLIAYSGNDFGPMLKAESRAVTTGQLTRDDSGKDVATEYDDASPAKRRLVRNALIPISALILMILLGLATTGSAAIDEVNRNLVADEPQVEKTVTNLLVYSSSNYVLFVSSFLASVVAITVVVLSKSLELNQAIDAWVNGARSMFLALLILIMAWGVATVCDSEHLNTAGFLVELTQGILSVRWMPTIVFLLSAIVSFATGSSFSTMGLLMPLAISMTYQLLIPLNEAGNAPQHHLMLATIGAVLAGAIFGDHCSPISDTTVLSSAATGCDHLDHVATQLPYAVAVGLVSLLLGYIPVGLGHRPIILLPFGLIALFMLVMFLGRPVEDFSKAPEQPKDDTGMPDDLDLDALGLDD